MRVLYCDLPIELTLEGIRISGRVFEFLMKTQNIRITFAAEAKLYTDGPNNLIHRIRNLGEDIYRAIRGKRIATLLNADTATDSLDLIVPSAGKVRRVRKLIDECLVQNNFQNARVEVTEAHSA